MGTQEQVRLAATAATEFAAGRAVHTAELVVSLRDFIRGVLGLEPMPADVSIPKQGPARPGAAGRGGKGGMGGGAAAGGGAGIGLGIGIGGGPDSDGDKS